MGEQTVRQKFLKLVYPAISFVRNRMGKPVILENTLSKQDGSSFYALKTRLSSGKEISLESFSGKKILIVNTASNCGFTAQYQGLQDLFVRHQERLVILAFPSNDFKEQEPDSDEVISNFCQVNYGVSFPIMSKSQVIKGAGQNPVYAWLTQPAQNGWNEQAPTWNFSKYLVNEKGQLTHYFDTAIEPGSELIERALL